MNTSMLRRMKRVGARLGTGPKPPQVTITFFPGDNESGESELPDDDTPVRYPWARSWVFVNWIPAEGRNSLTSGERIVRDWSRRKNGDFYARERITKDPADTGLRCELPSDLAARIQHREDEFERETTQDADSVIYVGKSDNIAEPDE